MVAVAAVVAQIPKLTLVTQEVRRGSGDSPG